MERRNNYEIRMQEAQKRFLSFDQEVILNKWKLKRDSNWICLQFLGREYRIDRSSAQIWRKKEDSGESERIAAGFEEVLSIFDLLCHQNSRPDPALTFAPVNSLRGGAKTIGVGTGELHSEYVDFIGSSPRLFEKACKKLGAQPVKIGDIGYDFTVFEDLHLRLKFYEADEEFPAQLICLWDENALSYLYYETAFYVMGYLYQTIEEIMKKLL